MCCVLVVVCDLVPWPGIEPRPPALGVQSLSHWTIRQVPGDLFLWWTLYPGSLAKNLLSINRATPKEASFHTRFRNWNREWIMINILCRIWELLVFFDIHSLPFSYKELSPAAHLPLTFFLFLPKILTLDENIWGLLSQPIHFYRAFVTFLSSISPFFSPSLLNYSR